MTQDQKTLDFIKKAKKVHGDAYDYSKIHYINNLSLIEVVCKTHGLFVQRANNFLKYNGCQKCSEVEKLKLKREKYKLKFIERAKIIHGNKYDYSKSEYKKAKTNVIIICYKHGEFIQTPDSHIAPSKKSGCPKCKSEKLSVLFTQDTSYFIKKANLKHKKKYDYSKVNYKGGKCKVKIKCLEHGYFWQQANKHLCGRGCPKCAHNSSVNTKIFISRSNKIHKRKYAYSLVDYKTSDKKVKIICKKHGIFMQTPNSHLGGAGCSLCNGGIQYDKLEFLKKAHEVHGNRFDYSLVDYSKSNVKIKIICKIHGIFEQIPASHLKGTGCSICTEKKKKTTETFIIKAKKIHGDKYDYSIANYKGNLHKVDIICKKHGIFSTLPSNHYRSGGCKSCQLSVGELKINNHLININIFPERQKKFSNCTNPNTGRSLPFDFYISEYNLLIEYDGEQHYRPVAFNNHKNYIANYQLTVIKDKIKTNYCRSRHINLLRIPYWDKHRIPELIDRKIKKIKQKALQ